MAWSFIKTLEWVIYRDTIHCDAYESDVVAGRDPTSVTILSLAPGFEDDELLRIPFFNSLGEAQRAIVQKAFSGELSVCGTPLLTPSQQIIPSREFYEASIAEEIIPPNKIEHRLWSEKRRLDQWSGLLFDEEQVKLIWPSQNANTKGAGRKTHPNKRYAIFWLNGLLESSERREWLKGKQKQEVRNLLISKFEESNKLRTPPLPIPARSTLDSWIIEWLNANPKARQVIGTKWAKC